MEVSLHEILEAREARVQLQQKLLQEYACPLICFTMNIAGPIKNTPLIQRGFRAGMEALEAQLPTVRYQTCNFSKTGCTAMYVVDTDAAALKQICTKIEESHPLGRLFDMDVLDKTGAKLERNEQRSCLVCRAPGRGCAASRAHSVAQLQQVTNGMLKRYFIDLDAAAIAQKCVDALIDEVNTTPKPGLVDRRNNGSHKDMDIGLFIASAKALQPYFSKCVKIGHETAESAPEESFQQLRLAGIEAEKVMFATTGGVNTHKGAIYTLGVICGSIGRLWQPEKAVASLDDILQECRKLTHQAVREDFIGADGSTAGQRLYVQYGLTGIRGEVAAGLPSVANLSLPCYKRALRQGSSHNDAGIAALLTLIANIQDTNLYHRGGAEGAKWAAATVTSLISTNSALSTEQLKELDDAFIARNLSPGGSADLLAVTYFLHTLFI